MADDVIVKKWWQSSNFWTAAVLLVGGLFVGFPESIGRDAVAGIFALIAVGKSAQNYLTNAEINWRKWLDDANFWNYLGTVAIALLPALPGGVLENLEQAVRAAIGGNWQGVIISFFSLGTILWKVFRPENTK